MCGNGENGLGIIMGLIGAAAMLMAAFAEKHSGVHAVQPQHTISAPSTHVAIEMRPLTLDVDLEHARASLEVRL